MGSKGQIVHLHRRRKALIPQRILLAYQRRIQKRGIRYEIGDKAKDVDEGEIDGCSAGGASPDVNDGLGVEGERPAEGVDPAEEVGGDFQEGMGR